MTQLLYRAWVRDGQWLVQDAFDGDWTAVWHKLRWLRDGVRKHGCGWLRERWR